MSEKVRENRLRRMAQRQGLRLKRSRVRDPMAFNYGRYWLSTGDLDVAEGFDSLDALETYLLTGSEQRRRTGWEYESNGETMRLRAIERCARGLVLDDNEADRHRLRSLLRGGPVS